MPKYHIIVSYVTAILSADVEAKNVTEAQKKFEELDLNEINEEPERLFTDWDIEEVKNICGICNQPEDDDGRCTCTNKDSN